MNIVLVKQHDSMQLAHLYEHIFISNINSYLFEKGVLKQLDYSLTGSTFEQGGIITIDFIAHNKKAAPYINKLAQIPFDLGEDNSLLAAALHQIAAEESFLLHTASQEDLIAELLKLNSQPWSNLDSLTYTNTKEARPARKVLYLTDKKVHKPGIADISIALEKNFSDTHPELVPIFLYVSRILLINIATVVSRRIGVYPFDIESHNTGTKLTHIFSVAAPPFSPKFSVEDTMSLATQAVGFALNTKLIRRTHLELSRTSYLRKSSDAPNFERILVESSILIGSKGWKILATEENIALVLHHSALSVKYGPKNLETPLL